MNLKDFKPKKIIIIDLAFIGDVILATPVTRAVHAKWPDAAITMLTVPLTAQVAQMNPYVDKTIVYDKRGRHKGLWGMWQMAGELRKHNYDLAICMNFAVRGAVVARLAGIPYRLGYDAQHGGLFLTWAMSHIRHGIKHETLNHLEVLEPIGLSAEDTSLELEPPMEAVNMMHSRMRQMGIVPGKYYVVCPFGSYERKNMPLSTAAQLIRELNSQLPVYLIGGQGEKTGLLGYAKAGKIDEGHVFAGTLNLQELAVFLSEAAGMVSVDTGPMHMAQAVNCPTVAMFGPTDPKVWGPQNNNSCYLYTGEPCSPCWGKGECQDNICMKKIKAKDLYERLQ
ncbi:MAG: glycosyltransferase family 9 protein [Anaerovibrio sp.]|uniref:glycosyltransferase family 9 protein n=1 Tax=Anaerovibrio sp. TaxID=1872532 RepID=UPI0025D43B83|nr:glycosyltransferase family 9 protein [Anaerovibrio sp.]MCR5176520.1 glycosyltransferase family 9 protein [Anaerovibrio sp.]